MEEHKNTGVTISLATSVADIDQVRELLREYIAWALTLAPDADKAPPFHGIQRELEFLPGIYAPPAGRLLLAMHEGQAAGTVCLKGHDSKTSEVKRLYVRPDMRGLNIGRLLIERLVEEARAAGYRKIILDSHVSMSRAHAIYEGAGFRHVDAPLNFPEHLKTVAIFMECDLQSSPP